MLDFSSLTRPNFRELYIGLPFEIEEAINVFPETSGRFEGALKFCWFVSATPDSLHADEPKATRIREAFLRASLAEYVSTEDTLKRDLVKLNIKGKAIKTTDSTNPLLHIMRELRNLEIHLTSSQLSKSRKAVKLIVSDAEHQSQTTIWTVNDLTVQKFRELKFARNRYSREEIEKMVNWFNEAQHDWGVNHLLFRAIVDWATEIVKAHLL